MTYKTVHADACRLREQITWVNVTCSCFSL